MKWSKTIRRNLLRVALCATTSHAYASGGVPNLFAFQGRASDTYGDPITTTATFNFRIYPPVGSCYIYEDTQTITPNEFGFFSTVLGLSANSTGPANNFADVYSNQASVPTSCSTVYAPDTYTPMDGDWRRIEIVADGTPMPTMQTIGAVPFAQTRSCWMA